MIDLLPPSEAMFRVGGLRQVGSLRRCVLALHDLLLHHHFPPADHLLALEIFLLQEDPSYALCPVHPHREKQVRLST